VTDLAVRSFTPFTVEDDELTQLAADFAATGAAVIGPPALDRAVFDAVVAEARTERAVSGWRLPSPGHESVANQITMRAQLGPVTRQLMSAGATRSLIQAVTGRLVLPDWSTSCFTYYDEPGSYLGFHCDNPISCTVAFLLYLEATWAGPAPGPGHQLHVCRTDIADEVVLRITGHPGRLVILNGAEQAHGRPPLAEGESLVLLSACYRTLART